MNDNMERVKRIIALSISPHSKDAERILFDKLNLFRDTTADSIESIMHVVIHSTYLPPSEDGVLVDVGSAYRIGRRDLASSIKASYTDVINYRTTLSRTDVKPEDKIEVLVELDKAYNYLLASAQKLSEEKRKAELSGKEAWRDWV